MQARDNKLTIEDMAGGTFTISNVSVCHGSKAIAHSNQGGVFGSLMGTPIINLPQTGNAEGTYHRFHPLNSGQLYWDCTPSRRNPWPLTGRWRFDRWVFMTWSNGALHTDRWCQMMYLALTYDHRLLDGREAVVFLVKARCP